MKSFIYLLIAFTASAYAQNIPSCATTCLTNGIIATGCSSSDTACICSSSDLLPSVTPCVEASCSAADQAATIEFAQAYCAAAGVTITIPPPNEKSTVETSTSPAAATSTSEVASPDASFVTTSAAAAATTTSAAPVATYTGLAAPMARPAGIGSFGLLGLAALFVLTN